jgi:hypothetical protein
VPTGDKVELIKADALGVDCLSASNSTPTPVPLSHPHLVQAATRNERDGKYVFQLPAIQSGGEPIYWAVVAKPVGKNSKDKALVSYPISLTR